MLVLIPASAEQQPRRTIFLTIKELSPPKLLVISAFLPERNTRCRDTDQPIRPVGKPSPEAAGRPGKSDSHLPREASLIIHRRSVVGQMHRGPVYLLSWLTSSRPHAAWWRYLRRVLKIS